MKQAHYNYNLLHFPSGMWYTGNCGIKKGFMCKKAVGSGDGPQTVPPTPPTTGFCPEGWLDAGSKCFLMDLQDNQYGFSWEDAIQECRGMSVQGLRDIDIATIANIEEQGR